MNGKGILYLFYSFASMLYDLLDTFSSKTFVL